MALLLCLSASRCSSMHFLALQACGACDNAPLDSRRHEHVDTCLSSSPFISSASAVAASNRDRLLFAMVPLSRTDVHNPGIAQPTKNVTEFDRPMPRACGNQARARHTTQHDTSDSTMLLNTLMIAHGVQDAAIRAAVLVFLPHNPHAKSAHSHLLVSFLH